MRATTRRNRADVRIKAMPMRCDARAASRHMGPMISDTAWLELAGDEISGTPDFAAARSKSVACSVGDVRSRG